MDVTQKLATKLMSEGFSYQYCKEICVSAEKDVDAFDLYVDAFDLISSIRILFALLLYPKIFKTIFFAHLCAWCLHGSINMPHCMGGDQRTTLWSGLSLHLDICSRD